MQMFDPLPPGAILREYMGEGLTVTALAKHLDMPRQNLSMILNSKLGLTAAVAMKLSEAFPNSTPQFWLNLQTQYDLAQEMKKKRRRIKPLKMAA